MKPVTIEYTSPISNTPKLWEINYGVFVTGIKGNPESVYLKVNKRKNGDNITLRIPQDFCLLLNVKTGQMRTVEAGTPCTILCANIQVEAVRRESEVYFKK